MTAHFDRAWLFAKRLGVCDADLDDVMQEVTTITFQRLDQIKEGSEKSFVFGTTFRVASEHRRRRGRRKEAPEELAASVLDPAIAPDVAREQRQARALLDEILDAMPMDLRAVFVLYELDEREQTEIAELLDIPVGTVASRLRRAREDFNGRVARLQARERSMRQGEPS
ncbi:MAG: sigma-70 family RNA polymerase sigma factor [Polyangiaceae bacterium]